MTQRRLLVVDPDPARREAMIDELHGAGYEPAALGDEDIAAIVVGVYDGALPPYAHSVPVVAVLDEGDAEVRLRAAIAGAVRCVRHEAVAAAVDAVLAPDAPSLPEQLRQARVDALEAWARTDGDDNCSRSRVRLTRLEHRPVRVVHSPASDRESRLAGCTPKQTELLDLIARTGSVTNAAAQLGASRSTIYATLRRIVHRLQLRDSGDLLRLLGAEDPFPGVVRQ